MSSLRPSAPSPLRPSQCYRALLARDDRYDGRFFTGVVTTGVFCRPVCPAKTPLARNCLFFASAAAAQAAGFRPCLRCRPESAPATASWRGTAATVSRALQLIGDGALDDEGDLPALAARLGLGERQLRRLFLQHLGAPPVAVAQARRALFAKALLQQTALPASDVALAAGFGSLRRFNAVMRRALGRAPSELRRAKADAGAAVSLRLPFAGAYDWPAMLGWLGPRAIGGVESVSGDRYARTIALDGAVGTIEVAPARGALIATVRLSKLGPLAQVAARLRKLFDLSADTTAIDEHLSRDAMLKPLVRARPGLRVPGAWDAFELAVRAILGQQISVAAARTLAARIAESFGESLPAALGADGLNRLFPGPARVAAADLTRIGLTTARAKSLHALAEAALGDALLLAPSASLEESIERLTRLPGVGPWTAHYIALRALREPDAFPASDLGLLRASGLTAAELSARAEAWRPYRAYAALHLWSSL